MFQTLHFLIFIQHYVLSSSLADVCSFCPYVARLGSIQSRGCTSVMYLHPWCWTSGLFPTICRHNKHHKEHLHVYLFMAQCEDFSHDIYSGISGVILYVVTKCLQLILPKSFASLCSH